MLYKCGKNKCKEFFIYLKEFKYKKNLNFLLTEVVFLRKETIDKIQNKIIKIRTS